MTDVLQPAPSRAAAIFRLLVLFEAQRAGLDAAEVMVARGEARRWGSAHWHRLIGCRHTAIYLAHTVFGLSYSDISQVAHVQPPRITRIMHDIEDAREADPALERWFSSMEAALYG